MYSRLIQKYKKNNNNCYNLYFKCKCNVLMLFNVIKIGLFNSFIIY